MPLGYGETNLATTAGNALSLQLAGSGATVSIWTSTNLIEWSLWTNLPPIFGPVEMPDPAATNQPCRFYRVRSEL